MTYDKTREDGGVATVDAEADANRDPITDEPGSHPVGTGVGAAGGGAAGAVAGAAVGGPVGALVGGAAGAIVGGAAGHAVAERIDPTVEDAYWSENYSDRDYVGDDDDYDTYRPAYRHGWESYQSNPDRDWDDELQAEMREEWNELKTDTKLEWEEAKLATRDAWHTAKHRVGLFEREDEYWRNHYSDRPYVADDDDYETYRPAYREGWKARHRYPNRDWDDRLEAELREEWQEAKHDTRLGWEKAKQAVRDGWHHVERALPGDFDNDGR